jgi:hydroxymethylpyrimidine pyrophosphatase-like HAD family hydrolase
LIFVTDLDRTMIYSNRHIGTLKKNRADYVCAEKRDGIETTFMTKRAYDLFCDLSSKTMVIPCTTRTIEQYIRIDLISSNSNINYAICNNGGSILIGGVEDLNWSSKVKKKIVNNSARLKDVLARSNKMIDQNHILDVRIVENLFYYYIMNEIPSEEVLGQLEDKAGKLNWKIYMHGRKLYYIPNELKKSHAVNYLINILEIDSYVAAGDSILDLDFLESSTYSIVPFHGTIDRSMINGTENFFVTKVSGIKAAEEILELASGRILF